MRAHFSLFEIKAKKGLVIFCFCSYGKSSSFVVSETRCSSRVGERQGQLAGAVGGQAGAVVLRKETTLWDS